MKTKTTLLSLVVIFSITTLFSCQKTDEPVDIPVPTMAEKTVIFYMVADNNLSKDMLDNAFEAIGAKDIDYTKNNVVIFIDHNTPLGGNNNISTKPQIIRVLPDSKFMVVKEFSETNICSESYTIDIFKQIVAAFPAKTYGVVLSAHGNGWQFATVSKAFGGDEIGEGNTAITAPGALLNIDLIAKAIPANCDFVVLDACNMAAVETAYELKDKSKYLIASAFIVPGTGLDYKTALPLLIQDKYKEVVDGFYAKYEQTNCQLSVINTAKLAVAVDKQKEMFTLWGINGNLDYALAVLQEPQSMQASDSDPQFDYVDVVEKIGKSLSKDAKPLVDLIKASVEYQRNSPTRAFSGENGNYVSKLTPICCGLSVAFEPDVMNVKMDNFKYYKTLKWYSDSGIDLFYK